MSSALWDSFAELYEHNVCPFTKGLFLDIINDVAETLLVAGGSKRTLSTKLVYAMNEADGTAPSNEQVEKLAGDFECQSDRMRDDRRVQGSVRADSSLLRRAISRYLVLHNLLMFSEPHEAETATKGLSDLLLELADTDTDNCCAILEDLGSILSRQGRARLSTIAENMMPLLCNFLRSIKDNEVKAVALSVLADLVDQRGVIDLPSTPVSDMGRDSASMLDKTESSKLHESSIRLFGSFVDLRLTARSEWAPELADQIHIFGRQLRCALHESNVSLGGYHDRCNG